jgi:hypothetical protein
VAYGAYTLFAIWAERHRGLLHRKKSSRYCRKILTIICGLGLGTIYGLGLLSADTPHNPGIGRFLGTVWAGTEGNKASIIEVYFPSIGKKSAGNPGYAFLHPDSPTPHLAGPGKKFRHRRPARRPKSRKSHHPKRLAKR